MHVLSLSLSLPFLIRLMTAMLAHASSSKESKRGTADETPEAAAAGPRVAVAVTVLTGRLGPLSRLHALCTRRSRIHALLDLAIRLLCSSLRGDPGYDMTLFDCIGFLFVLSLLLSVFHLPSRVSSLSLLGKYCACALMPAFPRPEQPACLPVSSAMSCVSDSIFSSLSLFSLSHVYLCPLLLGPAREASCFSARRVRTGNALLQVH